ncbi:HNH endonuclease [Hymenobacter sp. BT175]|uniref:HNH endonuclease n=1 Tax=Hymenobacter translucens TaxID=2886507 RepID=UPI001D0EAB53|nr:HNH endonuclease [Hymenobacter translucens]MCC2547705.1 HNH endonuclease [Hymenobacter translucens]
MEQNKKCSRCGEEKALADFTYMKDKAAHKAACKACINASIKALRKRPDYTEAYKQKERERNAERAGYLKQWMADNAPRLKELTKVKPRPKRATSCPVYFNTCIITGELFTARRPTAKYSEQGSSLMMKKRNDARIVNKADTAKQCKACGKDFTRTYGASIKAFCSEACRDEMARQAKRGKENHRRRARHFGVFYTPINVLTVFDRDKWTCQLCGIKTPKSKRGTMEPNAPELDHILPLSKGGTHEYHNVQCACRQCNSIKGDKAIGQLQMRLAA